MIFDGFLRALKLPEEKHPEERSQIFYDQNEKQFKILSVPFGAEPSTMAVPGAVPYGAPGGASIGTTQDRGRASQGAGGTKKLSHGSNFKWKSARNNGKAVKSLKMVLLNGGAVVVALAATYAAIPAWALAKTWMLAVALFILTDPFEFVTRSLSLQARIIIASCLTLTVVALSLEDMQFRKVTYLIDALGLLIVIGANVGWLSAENWHMSRAIERALQWDPDCKSGKAWTIHGRRETKTLLHEIGYSLPEYELDFLARAIYMLGFVHGYTKTTKAKQKLEAATKRAEDAERWNDFYKNRADACEEWKAKYDAEKEERETVESQLKYLKDTYKKLKMEYDMLIAVDSEEFEEEVPADPKEQQEDETRDQYAARLYKELDSYQKVADTMGISKTQARRLVAKAAEAGEEEIVEEAV